MLEGQETLDELNKPKIRDQLVQESVKRYLSCLESVLAILTKLTLRLEGEGALGELSGSKIHNQHTKKF